MSYTKPGLYADRMLSAVDAELDRLNGETIPLVGMNASLTANLAGAPEARMTFDGSEKALLAGKMQLVNVSGVDAQALRTDIVGDVAVISGVIPRVAMLASLETDLHGAPDVARSDNAKRRIASNGKLIMPQAAGLAADAGTATLYLNGAGNLSYIESKLSGPLIQRWFGPSNPVANARQTRWQFNPDKDVVGGVTVRAPKDDATPDHIFGTTIGANHGYPSSLVTAAAHGKTAADIGSIWANGGNQFVLVEIVSTTQLLLTRVDSSSMPQTGTYTHVSGATATANIVVTARADAQWMPPAQDLQLRALVDGEEVGRVDRGALTSGTLNGVYTVRDAAQFVEVCEYLSKAEMIAWKQTRPASLYPTGRTASLRVTTVYEYDKFGGLAIYRDWLVLQPMPISDIMGMQMEAKGAFDTAAADYYIPNTLPFAYNGATINYSMKVPADLTMVSPDPNDEGSVKFTPAKIEATGPALLRAYALYDSGYFDASGFLPVGSAADDVRRSLITDHAMEIRGDTGKRYWRLVDKGDFMAAAGEYFSCVIFRNVGVTRPDRTAFTVARTREAAYIMIDWHNRSGLDTIELPPDLVGRAFTVSSSRNATVKGTVLSGRLSVDVAAPADYATLTLRAPR